VADPESNNDDDATIILTPANPDSGGPVMDATRVVQSDGTTEAVRERVDIGYASPDQNPRGPLVGKDFPLPVDPREVVDLLTKIEEHLRVIRVLQEMQGE